MNATKTKTKTAAGTASERLLNQREAAHELRVSVGTIANLRASRALEFIRIGGQIRFSPGAIERFKAAGTVAAETNDDAEEATDVEAGEENTVAVTG